MVLPHMTDKHAPDTQKQGAELDMASSGAAALGDDMPGLQHKRDRNNWIGQALTSLDPSLDPWLTLGALPSVPGNCLLLSLQNWNRIRGAPGRFGSNAALQNYNIQVRDPQLMASELAKACHFFAAMVCKKPRKFFKNTRARKRLRNIMFPRAPSYAMLDKNTGCPFAHCCREAGSCANNTEKTTGAKPCCSTLPNGVRGEMAEAKWGSTRMAKQNTMIRTQNTSQTSAMGFCLQAISTVKTPKRKSFQASLSQLYFVNLWQWSSAKPRPHSIIGRPLRPRRILPTGGGFWTVEGIETQWKTM